MALTESLFELITPFTVGDLATDDITSANFTIANTELATYAAADGLTGTQADWGTAYLIADLLVSKKSKKLFRAEKIGDYSYTMDESTTSGGSYWMEKYNSLVSKRTVSQPSAMATRADKDMSGLGLDQNPIYGV